MSPIIIHDLIVGEIIVVCILALALIAHLVPAYHIKTEVQEELDKQNKKLDKINQKLDELEEVLRNL